MEIAIIVGHELPFPPTRGGGAHSLLDSISKEMVKRGHSVTVFSPLMENEIRNELLFGVKHVRVKGFPRNQNHLFNFFLGLIYFFRVVRKLEKYDVINSHLLQGFLLPFFTKKTFITHTIHRDPKSFIKLFKSVDRIYAGTDSIVDEAKLKFPSLKEKFKTIYNGISFEGFGNPITRKRDGKIKYLFIGRFSEDKGLDSFIHGFVLAAKENPDIYFNSVGPMTDNESGEEKLVKKLEKIVIENELQDRITFNPPIYDKDLLMHYVKTQDVVVLPSIFGETLNMSIIECTRVGKAFLITDLAANTPLIEDGHNGFFVKVGDSEDWKNKILELSDDISLIEKFGRNSYLFGLSKFSIRKIVDEYIKDYERNIS